MVYVTHDQIEALTLADRIAVMKGGVIQQLAAPLGDLQPPVEPVRRGLHRQPVDELPEGRTVDGGRAFQFGATKIDLAGYDGGAVLERDQAILGVRPEHITVSTTPWPGRRSRQRWRSTSTWGPTACCG
jgi:multiple sugar transport system ATP-binding protein